jgi:diguanylate cyclase (GGDEF)-like protein
MCFGAVVWLTACLVPTFPNLTPARIILSSLIVATYTFLIAAELSRERRKPLRRRWPALFVPMLHGAIFLCPVALASLGVRSLATGWVAVFAIEVVLYVVGAAFIVLVLVKDRAVSRYKAAAESDPLTGLLNRRGFFEAAAKLVARSKAGTVSVLAFDLDHFKSINDRFGHKTGDVVLNLFATVARKTMRAEDVVGRLGGEEFVAILSEKLPGACIAAERVRSAFEKAALAADSPQIPATVSIGVAYGLPGVPVDLLIARADAALYKAKGNGRNRVEPDNDMVTVAVERPAEARSDVGAPAIRTALGLSVPILVR